MQTPASQAFKRTTLLRRRGDWTRQAFIEHWAGAHAQIALRMPGIARYTQNRVIKLLWADPAHAAYDCDGIVELEFYSSQAMAEASRHEVVRKLLPEDERRFLDAITLCSVVGGARQVCEGMRKVMLAVCLSNENAVSDLAGLISRTGCAHFSVEIVKSVAHRPSLAYEEDPPGAFASLWFPEGSNLDQAFAPQGPWARQAPGVLRRGSAWHVDPLPVVGPGK